ncbi:MAG: ATP-binding protein [Planctomycetes bacterium]|nr:ATP-binding protein [Planctomycetota bacterium]
MITLKIGPDIIRNYRRLSYTHWHALAEFVDNSTQSYANNRKALSAAYRKAESKLEVSIAYDKKRGLIRIYDNAMGMSFRELERALEMGRVPEDDSGRSQYGMGMKTAACWLGDTWTITTKRLGEADEHTVTIDVESVASGKADLGHKTKAKDKDAHYTIIEIRSLHQKIAGRRLGKIKDFLSSMYRHDLTSGELHLEWDGKALEYLPEKDFLKAKDGQPYHRDFAFTIGKKKVHGWIAILKQGGRPKAGFSVLRRGRMIMGHPDAWRPESIYGQMLGSNDLVNQRIVGEIHLDDFDVSHTKDDILWSADEEDQLQEKLKECAQDFMKIAKDHRTKGGDSRGPNEAEVQSAVDRLRTEMESKEFVDKVQLTEVPAPEVLKKAMKPVIDSMASEEPTFHGKIGNTTYKVYLSDEHSPFDPYFVTDVGKSDIMVMVNKRHPHFSELRGAEAVYSYLCHCVYDAIAEWQCYRKQADVKHDTVKYMKDSLLRLPFERLGE